jgi:hypothetical protein
VNPEPTRRAPVDGRKALLRDEEHAVRLTSADNEIWDDVT